MKKLVSGILAGISVMSSIPNVGATHFTSETKINESQSKSLDWKSVLLGGGLVGGIGIPVTALISTLIGKNIEKPSSTGEGLFKLANDEYAGRLKKNLDTKEYCKNHSDDYCGLARTLVTQYMNKMNTKKMSTEKFEVKSEEDLDFKKVFSVYKPCHHTLISDQVAIVPNETFGYDFIVVAIVTEHQDTDRDEDVNEDVNFIIFDFRNSEKPTCFEIYFSKSSSKWQFDECNNLIIGALEFGNSLESESYVSCCRGYRVSSKKK